MTPTQIKYARERLAIVYNGLEAKLRELETIPAISYTLEEKKQLIKTGKYKFNENAYAHNLSSLFDFGERSSTLTVEYTAKKAALDLKYRDVVDQIVLGDSDSALEAINAFAKTII